MAQTIPYHTPDPTWSIFAGVTDFESYAEKFVVRGRFYAKVLVAVQEGALQTFATLGTAPK